MTNKQNALKTIKAIALDIDHRVAFGGKSRGNKHLARVVRIARFLARSMGADLFITTAGAYLHDTALSSGNDYVYAENKRIVLNLLKRVKLAQHEKELIAECVASHEGTERPKTLEAKIVHDSDVIEKQGLLGIIRHTWKLVNSGKINPATITDSDIAVILKHIAWRRGQMQTPLARKIASRVSLSITKTTARKIIIPVASMAAQAIPTEKIAVALHTYLTQLQIQKLKEQLTLGYLRERE